MPLKIVQYILVVLRATHPHTQRHTHTLHNTIIPAASIDTICGADSNIIVTPFQ